MTKSLRLSSRDAIIEAAFTVFSKDPSAALSEVATLAGVGRATLHRHFAGREDLIRALAEIAIADMDHAVDKACEPIETYSEAVRKSLQALIPLGDRYGFLELEPLDDDPAFKREFERQQKETVDMIDGAKDEGLFDPSVPTNWIVHTFDSLLYAGWESVKAGDTTPDQAADLAWRTLTSGLKK